MNNFKKLTVAAIIISTVSTSAFAATNINAGKSAFQSKVIGEKHSCKQACEKKACKKHKKKHKKHKAAKAAAKAAPAAAKAAK